MKTQLSALQLERIESVLSLIRGFESTYALELLASVDYVNKQEDLKNVEEIKTHIRAWNKRKADLFQDEHIELAYRHLKEYGSALAF